MMTSASTKTIDGVALPPRLARFVAAQDYESYTPRDHAVWRHILRRLRSHLETRAHPIYLRGLAETASTAKRFPAFESMNERLSKARLELRWRARLHSPGSIHRAAEPEGARNRRGHSQPQDARLHPRTDIIHESAGHAPILIDSDYASYLQACGEIGYRAIESKEERALFEAVRNLSVVKEDPLTTDVELACAQFRLEASIRAIRYLSESARASRLFWWTAEYGLVGTLERPYLYGAGLLSSLGESEHCLSSAVRKHPLTLACVETPFDITRMQPQLYVARDFAQLHEVLEEFRAGLSWRKGGDYGLEEALRSGTVNHLVLEEYRVRRSSLLAKSQRCTGRRAARGSLRRSSYCVGRRCSPSRDNAPSLRSPSMRSWCSAKVGSRPRGHLKYGFRRECARAGMSSSATRSSTFSSGFTESACLSPVG